MPAPQTYEYAVIRYVPRVEREEFLNVGVLVFSKRLRYLDIRYQLDAERLLAFAPETDLDQLHAYLHGWTLICRGDPAGGRIAALDRPERFRWLAAARSTIIQCGPTHSGLCAAGEETLEKLFMKYVAG